MAAPQTNTSVSNINLNCDATPDLITNVLDIISPNGKRKRPFTEDERSTKRKTLKDERKTLKDAISPLKNPTFAQIYGKNGKLSLEVRLDKLEKRQDALHYWDFQNFMMWILGECAICPKWIFVKNKPLAHKFVVVQIPGLSAATVAGHPGLKEFFDAKCQEVPIRAEITTYNQHGLFERLVSVSCKKTKGYMKATKGVNIQKKVEKKKVWKVEDFLLNDEEMNMNDYPSVKKNPEWIPTDTWANEGREELVALDCEMVITGFGSQGFELARTTLIDKDGKLLYDEFNIPPHPIKNYNTRYSGVTKELLENVTRTVKDVQKEIQQFIGSETVICGHSLENDFKALNIVHRRVVDTSLLYPHPRPPRKSSLRYLAKKWLERVIQEDTHDSSQDATAALDLLHEKIKQGWNFGLVKPLTENLFTVLGRYQVRSWVGGLPDMLKSIQNTPASCVPVLSDAACVGKARKEIEKGLNTVVWLTLEALRNEKNEDDLSNILKQLNELYKSLPNNSIFCVYGSGGSLKTVQALEKRKKKLQEDGDYTTEQDAELRYQKQALFGQMFWLSVKHVEADD